MVATVAGLKAATEELTTATLALNQTLQSERRRKRFSRISLTALVIILVLNCVGTVVSWQSSENNGHVLDIMEDATTPGGKIYEDGVKRSTQFLCVLVTEQRTLHGVTTPCNLPVPKTQEPPTTPMYRDDEGDCVGMSSEDAERLGLELDPTC